MKRSSLLILMGAALATSAFADSEGNSGKGNACSDLPSYSQLKTALTTAVAAEGSGLDLQMWATIVDRDGIVCAVAFSGADRGAQWPGSRVISAQKANTANAFSLQGPTGSTVFPTGLALSTANLYSAVQPGGSLFGLQESNPVNTEVAYKGPASNFGKANDPMVGERIGGVNVFGGGLALYGPGKKILGAVGVSGDTSCADHNIGWRVRALLGLDHLLGVSGVATAARPDNIIFDIGADGKSAGGFGHPSCINTAGSATLPAVQN
ncbi:MAG: hypothetical protein RL328_388 [Acidobacteriota bacterium]|jgi:uncharacterized protein GlcG (DUF336 family)